MTTIGEQSPQHAREPGSGAEPAPEPAPASAPASVSWIGPAGGPAASPADALCIDCATCVMRHTDACDDCVVTFICSREPDEAVVVDADEVRALRLLSEAGLVPRLRHRRRTG